MTPAQIDYYLHWLPLIEFRRHLPLAQLEATLRNIMGGKDPDAKPADPSRYYTALELLPPYARLDETDEFSAALRADVAENWHRLPRWVKRLMPEGLRHG